MERRDIPGHVGPEGRIPDSFDDPRFPKVVGRTREPLEIATTIGPTGNPEIDHVVLKSVGSMDGRE